LYSPRGLRERREGLSAFQIKKKVLCNNEGNFSQRKGGKKNEDFEENEGERDIEKKGDPHVGRTTSRLREKSNMRKHRRKPGQRKKKKKA